jgi:hypothetical protein
MHIAPGRRLQKERWPVRVTLDFESIARATVLQSQIARVNTRVRTPGDVMTGAVTVGMNRLLSRWTTAPRALAHLMVPMPEVDGDELDVMVELADMDRVDDVQRFAASNFEVSHVIGACVRTGLAMLSGRDVTLGPLFRIVV